MAKNENNSHAFIRKMVENIKQTKDAQGPDDAKMNEVCNSLQIIIPYLFKHLSVEYGTSCSILYTMSVFSIILVINNQ